MQKQILVEKLPKKVVVEKLPEIKRVMLGVTIPPKEYQKADHSKMIENLLGKKTLKFKSPQFNNQQVEYEVVHVEVMPEATTAIKN